MVSAAEVTNHAQLAAAISSARTDGLEKIIVLTEDMYASAQFTVGTNRHISLVSDSDVAIRRGSGFINPTVEMFVMQGNATLRLGRYGTNGSVYVQGATGAVLPPLPGDPAEPPLPGDPAEPPAPAGELEIDGNNVLHGRGTVPPTVTNIVIPPVVTSIAAGAFHGDNLTNVIIPNTVETIGLRAFQHNYLTSVTIPNSVTHIYGLAFADNSLASVDIGNSVENIGQSAFARNNLTSVTIPDSVDNIRAGAFMGNNLTSINIGDHVNITEPEASGNAMGVHGVDFRALYEQYNRAAGTFVFANGSWSRQP
jgi:hypothetical protein